MASTRAMSALRAFLGSVAELDDELLDAMCAESLSRRHVR